MKFFLSLCLLLCLWSVARAETTIQGRITAIQGTAPVILTIQSGGQVHRVSLLPNCKVFKNNVNVTVAALQTGQQIDATGTRVSPRDLWAAKINILK